MLLAESVHQLVQGNTARAAAAMDAAAGGDAPPVDPDVVRTPTRAAALTHRVLLLVDDTPAGGAGWSNTTPRAVAEPRLTGWAEQRLGPAGHIVVHVAADGTRTTLDAAGLSRLDLGFDSVPDPTTLLAPHARCPAARRPAGVLGPDPLAVSTDPTWPAGLRAIGEVAVVAASLQRMIAGASQLTPASFAGPTTRRCGPSTRPGGSAGRRRRRPDGRQCAGHLARRCGPDLVAIGQAVDALRAYGIAFPARGGSSARRRWPRRPTGSRSGPAPSALPFDADQATARSARRSSARASPCWLRSSRAADLYGDGLRRSSRGRAAVRRWLRDVATVRPSLARYTETLLFGDAHGALSGPGRSLAVAQLAADRHGRHGRPGSGRAAPGRGGQPRPAGHRASWSTRQRVSLASDTVAGLVIDEWGEQMPRRDADGSATITTGLAVNANAPNARAPQAVLLAVSPDGSRWSTDGLVSLLTETRELAGLRAVTLERMVRRARSCRRSRSSRGRCRASRRSTCACW